MTGHYHEFEQVGAKTHVLRRLASILARILLTFDRCDGSYFNFSVVPHGIGSLYMNKAEKRRNRKSKQLVYDQ